MFFFCLSGQPDPVLDRQRFGAFYLFGGEVIEVVMHHLPEIVGQRASFLLHNVHSGGGDAGLGMHHLLGNIGHNLDVSVQLSQHSDAVVAGWLIHQCSGVLTVYNERQGVRFVSRAPHESLKKSAR